VPINDCFQAKKSKRFTFLAFCSAKSLSVFLMILQLILIFGSNLPKDLNISIISYKGYIDNAQGNSGFGA